MQPDYFDTLRSLSQPIRAADLPHTLEHMHRLLDALGNPQRSYRSVVVTGSTGKGTTCLRLADLLRIAGTKVGLYTSPHLHLFRERFALFVATQSNLTVPLQPPRRISQPEFVEMAQTVLAAARQLDHRYSTFELATALALLWFAQQQIEIAVLEIGIGGRFDAVNAVKNELAIFTPIEAEHVAMLGGSLESVAWHKAGIIQPGGQAMTVPQIPEVMAVLEREAHEKGADLRVGLDLMRAAADLTPYKPHLLTFSLAGTIQLMGRLERIAVQGHHMIIDGGHTPIAARHLRDFIGDPASHRLVVGMLRDKNVAVYLSVFDAPNIQFVYTHAPGDRALTPDELLARYQPIYASVTLESSLDSALDVTNVPADVLTVVAGSLRMAAAAREAYGLLSADDLAEARLTRAVFEGDDYQKKLKND